MALLVFSEAATLQARTTPCQLLAMRSKRCVNELSLSWKRLTFFFYSVQRTVDDVMKAQGTLTPCSSLLECLQV